MKGLEVIHAGCLFHVRVKLSNPTTVARVQFSEFLRFKWIDLLPEKDFYFLKGETPGTNNEKVTIQMVHDTVCKLANLNFFFDMFEVKYYWTYDAPYEVEDQIQPLMSPGTFLLPQEIPHSMLADHAKWLIQVQDFIWPWKGRKLDGFNPVLTDNPNPRKVASLEAAITHLYCSNVTYMLCHCPVLPHY